MKERKFVGIKKKDYYKVLKRNFYYKGRTTICALEIGIPITQFSFLLADQKELGKFCARYPNFNVKWINSKPWLILEIKSKSVCSNYDAYSVKIGKNVADAKAEMKLYSIMARILGYLAHRLEVRSNDAERVAEYFDLCYTREHNFVNKV